MMKYFRRLIRLQFFLSANFFISTHAQSIVVNAGKFQTVYLPANEVGLEGSATGVNGNAKYSWKKTAGPSSLSIASPSQSSTVVTKLVAGEYHFELLVADDKGKKGSDTVQVLVYATANIAVPQTNEYPNLLGSNPGYYGPGWNDMQIYTMMGNAGCRSTRSTIPMFFFTYYGDSSRYKEFNYFYNTLGFRENVFFLYNMPGSDYPDQSEEFFNGQRAMVPKGMYLPIWNKDGTVNMNNTFAKYCYKTVTIYGKFFKYFEVWNEPDFTGNWGAAGAARGTKGNWWENDPDPSDLGNLKAPAQYYIRMLRIAYEVIKRYKPEALITIGGVGYLSFLDFILRNTDNPNADSMGKKGSVSAGFPLRGGAYFDGLSFHSYPQFYLKYWDYTTKNMGYKRNSDEAIDQTIRDKQKFEKILYGFGYNGGVYPRKPVICTEINISRKKFGQEIGGVEVQRNFAWKTIAQAAKNNISQVYWFTTGETADYDSATDQDGFKLMGLYKNLLTTQPGKEQLTEEGIANKSAGLLLQHFSYDSALTKALNLSPNIDGLAFRNRFTGEIRFMLWAKTCEDLNEHTQAFYSFPSGFVNKKLDVYKWNYAVTSKKTARVEPNALLLTGEPVILAVSGEKSIIKISGSKQPLISAGRDTLIHEPLINLNGRVTRPLDVPLHYYWDIVALPASQGDYPAIKNKNTLSPTVIGLQKGLYAFRLTASDRNGLYSTDTVWVGVDTAVSFSSGKIQTSQLELAENLTCADRENLLINCKASLAKHRSGLREIKKTS